MDNEFYIRNAKIEDFFIIKKFIMSPKTTYFGPPRRKDPDAEQFFRHYATYRLIVFENIESDIMIAYGELRNYPYLFPISGLYWLDFIKMHYCLTLPISVINTLFLNYCTIATDANPILIKSLLSEIFYRENQLLFIMIIEPPDCGMLGLYRDERLNYYVLENISEVFYPRIFSVESCPNTQKLHVISRSRIIPEMSFRKALAEDNDDIIELIDFERPDLRRELGDYYIAEELLKLDEQHNMIIVTEIHNQTAGFIWLNDNVDIILLLKNFNLDYSITFVKCDGNKENKKLELPTKGIEKKPPIKLFLFETIEDICDPEYIRKYNKIMAGVCERWNADNSSTSSIITTIDEDYSLRQEFFRKIKTINEQLLHNSHYTYLFNLVIIIYVNVTKSTRLSLGSIQTPRCCSSRCSWSASTENNPNIINENLDYDSYQSSLGFPAENNQNIIEENSDIFALQLFGIHENYDIRNLYRLIMAAFAAYPHRDYCVLSLPIGTPMTKNLKLILKYFVRMTPRPGCEIHDEVYVTHRSSIYGEITIHDIRKEDSERIYTFSGGNDCIMDYLISSYTRDSINPSNYFFSSDGERNIIKGIFDDVFNNPFSIYTVKTIRCGLPETSDKTKLVGFIILRPFNNIHVLSQHYKLPKENTNVIYTEILTAYLHIFYHHQVDLIFRELVRVTNDSELLYFQTMRGRRLFPRNDLLLFMEPIEPKPYKTISKATGILKPSAGEVKSTVKAYKNINYVTDYFALYHFNLKPLKYCGSDKPIVIIGFSPICKAFLRTLIFNWNMPGSSISLSNNCIPQFKIVVITETGVIEAEYDRHFVCKTCAKKGVKCYVDHTNWNDFIADVTLRMDVRKYIHFISGNIKTINRTDHHIIFRNDCHIYYDQLLLLCDTSFGYPKCSPTPVSYPLNYIQINNRFDRILALHKIEILRKDLKEKFILIYGAHLRTFEFIEFLISHNIESKSIKLVIPNQKGIRISQSVFNQPVTDERLELILQDMIRDMGIEIYLNLSFLNWETYTNDNNNIKKVIFESTTDEIITIHCEIFVCFYETYIEPKFVEILREAKIEMNHRNIIVDKDFKTNDPAIFALGNFIEHKNEPNHQYKFVSHKEAAEKLIYKLGLIPVQLEKPFDEKFSQPHSCEVQLPMDYTMFKAVSPKRYMINHLDNEYSYSLITYNGTFSRVRLSPAGIVEEIVIMTRQKISFQFLLKFVGKHEKLLNNLKARWCHEDIICFLEFFQEPWTEFILHESFDELLKINRELMIPIAKEFMDLNIERSIRKKRFEHCAKDNKLHKKLEEIFIKYVREHRDSFNNPIALSEDFPT